MKKNNITKQKLLVFHPALAPYRVDFFNALSNRYNTKFYFSSKNVVEQKFNQDLLNSKTNFKSNYLNNGFSVFKRFVRFGFLKLIIDFRPDIVFTSELSQITIVIFLFKKFFNKQFKLYTIEDDNLEIAKSKNGLRKLLRDYISKHVDGVILPSKIVCEWTDRNIIPKQTLEVPIIHSNNVFRKQLANSLKVSLKIYNNYNLKEKKIILYTGRLVSIKNVAFLLKAFESINNANSVLVIVGDGYLKQNLIDLSIKLQITDKVIFTGKLEGCNLLAWYNLANVFVLPSIFERYAAVVNEALLAGCYVFCSNKAGASALITSENGKLFDPYDKEDFTLKLQDYLDRIDTPTGKYDKLRDDLMPFTLESKLEILFSKIDEK